MRTERLEDGRTWFRLADPSWGDPLDPTWAGRGTGSRWTPPGGVDTLHGNADVATARANVRRFLAGSPVAPEDLDDDRGFVLVDVVLPDGQEVADARSDDGVVALGLPVTYPHDADGKEVGHGVCQAVGAAVAAAGLDGVSCRSAAGDAASGLAELAWFARGRQARATAVRRFGDWYYG